MSRPTPPPLDRWRGRAKRAANRAALRQAQPMTQERSVTMLSPDEENPRHDNWSCLANLRFLQDPSAKRPCICGHNGQRQGATPRGWHSDLQCPCLLAPELCYLTLAAGTDTPLHRAASQRPPQLTPDGKTDSPEYAGSLRVRALQTGRHPQRLRQASPFPAPRQAW